GWGRIVNISSSTVPLGRPGFVHYVTSKAAILGMTRSIARELGNDNITVNCVMPGLTETEGSEGTSDAIWDVVMRGQAIPRREQAEDVVGAVMFLVSDAAEFITGQTIVVDGGSAHL
ncbi:MAG: SDR family NAD(P)-dependent oxidoreductase, partial [Alphaproteobacteria bacterium]